LREIARCTAARFDDTAKLVHLVDLDDLDAELLDLGEAADNRFDRAREHVDPAYRDHVVDPSGNPARKLHQRPSARTATAYRIHPIAGAVADRGHAPAAEVGEHELALSVVAQPARRGVEDLDDELRLIDVDPVARGAGEAVGAHLGRAGVVE